jgi:hypothetical protein
MRKFGYAVLIDPDAKQHVQEWNARVCNHCGKIDHIPPFDDGTNLGGMCKRCMGLICAKCVDWTRRTGRCRPQDQWMREMEERARRIEARKDALRSYGL